MCSACRKVACLVAAWLTLAGGVEARELRVCADPANLPASNERREGFENRIVEILAKDLGATVAYTWWAQRRGFIRNTLNSGVCDLIPGVPSGLEMLRTTDPVFRSAYTFVTRQDGPQITSLDDPALRDLKVGVQLVGDDGFNTPPAHALARRGIVGNVRGYRVIADEDGPGSSARIVKAVADGEVDVALVWGPAAGYFAERQHTPLRVVPIEPVSDGPGWPMAFDMAMGVRKTDLALRDEIDAAIARNRAEIDRVLGEFRVPRVEEGQAKMGAIR
jgi:mxaJ protein